MKCLFIDCFAGISGDMMLGALIDLGVPQKHLKSELKKLKVSGYSIAVSRALRMGISGRRVIVRTAAHKTPHQHRSFADIEKIMAQSTLKSHLKDRALEIFLKIAAAEAGIHHKKIADIHFHEVGALDSIVDIVGSVIGMEYVGADRVRASTVPLGRGFVKCRHGTIPVPAPATVALLKGVPVYDSGISAELVTPTGAAILTGFADSFGAMAPMIIKKVGYGAGSRDLDTVPNLLRLLLGETPSAASGGPVWVLETNLDDMNPEWAGYLMEKLFAAGALDAIFLPAFMKKNRPGFLVQVLCPGHRRAALTRTLFQESTTAGVRSYQAERTVLKRRTGSLETAFGTIRVKVLGDDRGERMVPEFEECRQVAEKKGIALRQVYEAVVAAAAKRKL